MARLTQQDWELWEKERTYFKARETEGFTKDFAALEAHIKRLQEVAPKDKAGWPVGQALKVIDQLQRDFHRIQTLFNLVRQ